MSRIVKKKTPHLPLIRYGSLFRTSDRSLLVFFDIVCASCWKIAIGLSRGEPEGEARFMTILVGDVSSEAHSRENLDYNEEMML